MNKEKHPFMFNTKELKTTDYLDVAGTDGLPIEKTFNSYLIKCEQFKSKAKIYQKDNMRTKNSTLHNSKCGYERSEQLETEILSKREESMEKYQKAVDVTFFNEDPNTAYKCFNGMSKTIRTVRELHQERNEDLSEDFDKKRASWFTRYCILSRFIEAARKIIILNRLKKIILVLRFLTPESDILKEIGFNEETNKSLNEKESSKINLYPCICGLNKITT